MDSRAASLRSSLWLWIPAIWLGCGLIDATETVLTMRAEHMHHAWTRLFITSVTMWVPWAIVTAPAMRLNQRFPILQSRNAKTWLVHLSACAFIDIFFAGWSTAQRFIFNPYGDHGPTPPFHVAWLQASVGGILATIILYGAVIAVDTLLDSRSRLARQQAETAHLNEQLSKAQLDALRRQIEPHFLFNTLNSVSALIREHRNDAAVMMIAASVTFSAAFSPTPRANRCRLQKRWSSPRSISTSKRSASSIDFNSPSTFPAIFLSRRSPRSFCNSWLKTPSSTVSPNVRTAALFASLPRATTVH